MDMDRDQIITDLLLDLSNELGSSWKMIGRRLGLKDASLQNIEADNQGQAEKGFQMLLLWRQVTGLTDLAIRLVEGLEKANRVDLAQKYGPRFKVVLSYPMASSATLPQLLGPKETNMVDHLKQHYKKRNRIPMVPWAGKNGKIVTVDLGKVYTHLELLVDIDSPDLPIRFPVNLNDLFNDIKTVDENTTGADTHEETLASSSTRVVARGRTGSGKTTFMLKLTSDWADGSSGPMKDAVAVFLLQLKKLDHMSNLGDAIVDQLLPRKEFTPEFVEEFVEKNQERIVILLDGYDEFKGKGLDHMECGNIVKMLQRKYLPCVQVLVTTRPGRVGDFMQMEDLVTDEYRHIEITGFSSKDVDVYVRKIFKRRPKIGEKLLNYLEENHLKIELASLPLMCCAFCQLTKLTDGQDFKDMNTISSLFDKLIKCLLKYHPRSKQQRSRLPSWDSTEKDISCDESCRTDDSKDVCTQESDDSIFQTCQINEDDLLLQLGKVALKGFIRSTEEELIFSLNDFKDCKSGAREVVAMGCKVGLIIQDEDVEYRPTLYEDLEINNEDGAVESHTISFVLKIIQEKLAGMYLAKLSDGNEEERSFFMKCVEDIRTLQRATDLGNVLMFACGANREAARTIISHVVRLMEHEKDNIRLFMNGELHYQECQRVQRLFEFCLQLNFECQSKGTFNEILLPLLSGSRRIRLVGISSYVTKSLGYFLEHSEGLPIKSLQLIRLHLNCSSEFREFLNTFPGLESAVSNQMKRRRRRGRKENEVPLTEETRKQKIREGATKDREMPTYLLQRNDDTFFALLPLWEQVNRMQMSEWNFCPLIDGLKRCDIEELTLNGVKTEPADWKKLFKTFSSGSFTSLRKLTLSMNDICDEILVKLVPGLGCQSNLTHLKLSGNEVGPDFLDAFENCPILGSLQMLVLEKTKMNSESIKQVGDLLGKCRSLITLDIRRNSLSDDSAIIRILNGTEHCPKLEKLMVSLHLVTDKALNHLQTKTDTLARLKELHLVHTPVPEKVIASVAGILPAMPELEDLRISGTPPDKTNEASKITGTVSSEVADLFSEAVLKTPSLKFLSVLYTTFQPDCFIKLLEKCLEATQSGLKTLRFSKACLPEDERVRCHIQKAEKSFLRIWV